jgi:hypothetical protein
MGYARLKEVSSVSRRASAEKGKDKAGRRESDETVQ